MNAFEKLKQHRFYDHFLEVSAIPRGSGNETAIGEHILQFAAQNGLEAWRDDARNVVVKKPGSPGREQREPVILQCHLDMVCEKNESSSHDFLKDPILPVERDGMLTASGGTTLGADNAVGICCILAILEDKSLPHPPIEAVFTAEEEVGMGGMSGLDTARLESRRMLNLDSEGEGVVFCSCAGGIRYNITAPLATLPAGGGDKVYRLTVKGLRGGHSGVDIGKGRGNSLLLLARMISGLCAAVPAAVTRMEGGSKTNAIPRDAHALLQIAPDKAAALQAEAERLAAVLRAEYPLEEALEISLSPAESAPEPVWDSASLERALGLLLLVPNGVAAYSAYIPGEVDASSNAGILEMQEGALLLQGLVRSNTNSRIDDAVDRLKRLTRALGGEMTTASGYPAWEFRDDSPLRELCCRVYEAENGKPMEVAAIHGGLECALMAGKRPEMDMVSIGPDLYDVHTPDEKADIASVLRILSFVDKLLAEM